MPLRFQVRVMLLFAVLVVPMVRQGTAQETAESLWKSFRSRFPYHSQVVALSDTRPTGRVVIVSEPPPNITKSKIAAILGAVDVEIKETKVGFDGCVRDFVARIPRGIESEVDERIALLHREIFGTSYGARVVPLPAPPPAPIEETLDVSTSALELETWFLGADATAETIPGHITVKIADILDLPTSGVFRRVGGGLVAWAIPNGSFVDDFKVEARMWTIESDLVVGAVHGKGSTLIVGRERNTDVLMVPPLRFEMIVRLASVTRDEIAQSYERNHIFAGRIDNGHDWAPIYLSDELIDTEYGSLLNITDQLLKSWSQHGTVSYIDFPYPKPSRWPFEKPLSELFAPFSSSTLFNWNTCGATNLTELPDGRAVVSVAKTGALPITYSPSLEAESEEIASRAVAEEVERLERVGHKFFTEYGDPNIARAVQYATLFQIFRAFEFKTREKAIPQTDRQDIFAPRIREILTFIAEAEESSFGAGITSIVSSDSERLGLFLSFALARAQLARLTNGFDGDAIDGLADALAHSQLAPDEIVAQRTIAEAMAKNRDLSDEEVVALIGKPTCAKLRYRSIAHAVLHDDSWIELRSILMMLSNASSEMRRYAAAVPSRPGSWIVTASLVESWTDDHLSIGGHNIGARTPRIIIDGKVKAGKPVLEVGNDRYLIKVHPDDRYLVAENLSDVMRLNNTKAIQGRLIEAVADRKKSPTARKLDQALFRKARPHRSIDVAAGDWAESLRYSASEVTVVEQANGVLRITDIDGGSVHSATSRAGAVDAIVDRALSSAGRKQHFDVVIDGSLSTREALAFKNAVKLRLEAMRRSDLAKEMGVVRVGTKGKRAIESLKNLDVAKAEVKQLPSNGDVHQISIEIPQSASGSGKFLRIKASVKCLVQKVADIIKKLKALLPLRRGTEGLDLIRGIREDMRTALGATDDDVIRSIVIESDDFEFVRISGQDENKHRAETTRIAG